MNMLLDRKQILLINTQLAEAIGLNEAIVLQQISYWLEETNSGIQHEGQRWIYNTVEQWSAQFPFWAPITVKRTLQDLRERGFLKVAQLSQDPRDRTNYYTIDTTHPDLLHRINLIPLNGSNRSHGYIGQETTQRIHTPSGQIDPPKTDPKKPKIDEDFEQAWALYPRRVGGNPKNSAQHAWNARLKAGVLPQTMIDGVMRYAKFCEADGSVGTKFVKQAVTFFGKDEHYMDPWVYAEKPKRNTREAENDRRAREFTESFNPTRDNALGWTEPPF